MLDLVESLFGMSLVPIWKGVCYWFPICLFITPQEMSHNKDLFKITGLLLGVSIIYIFSLKFLASKLVFIKTMDTLFSSLLKTKSIANQITNKVFMVKRMADIRHNVPP